MAQEQVTCATQDTTDGTDTREVINPAEMARHDAAMRNADVSTHIIGLLLDRLDGEGVSNRDAVALAREIRQQQDCRRGAVSKALEAKDRACGHIEAF